MALSLSELTKLYGASNKAPAPVEPSTILPGRTTLEKLSKLYFTRETSRLYAAPCASAKGPQPHHHQQQQQQQQQQQEQKRTVAICLVVVDDLYHEAIWRDWATQVSEKYSAKLFVHAKFPDRITSTWLKPSVLSKTFRPEWNSPEVIRAMLAALQEALKDETCGRFVFATESCIPISSLDATGDALFAEDVSWLNAFDKGKTQWETGACFRSVDATLVPERAVWKAIPGWVMLTRRHAAEICNLLACLGDDLVRAWGPGGPWREGSGVWAPEEVFFATMLSLLGYLRRGGAGGAPSSSSSSSSSGLDQVRRKLVTYATFARSGEANPVSFDRLTPTLLAQFRHDGCLFARKFAKGSVSLAQWRALVVAPSAPPDLPLAAVGAAPPPLPVSVAAPVPSLDVSVSRKRERDNEESADTADISGTGTGSGSGSSGDGEEGERASKR